jgi:hypothetical protein
MTGGNKKLTGLKRFPMRKLVVWALILIGILDPFNQLSFFGYEEAYGNNVETAYDK